VTGLGRGGTTSVAELVSTLEQLYWTGLANLEDYDLCEAIERGDIGTAKTIVGARPDRWAIKRPHFWRYTARLQQVLEKRLAWVFVFRDPVAVTLRQAQASGRPVSSTFEDVATQYRQFAAFAANAVEPKALVSYEKSLTAREQLRWHLGQWLHGKRFTEEEWIS
jgi:hypothetical protein